MSRRDRHKYALADYTVELRDKGWYFGRPYGTSRGDYRGPYASTASVTLTIARQHKRENERRHRPANGADRTEVAASK